MIFGDQNSFAIEAEFTESSGKWLFGHLRFWLTGRAIGDFGDTTDLASSARWGRTFLASSAQRTRTDLDELTPGEVYQRLYGKFVVPVGAQVYQPRDEVWNRDPFVLDEVGESSTRDDYALLVVRGRLDVDRIVVYSYVDDEVLDVTLPPGVCDATLAAYCEWVESLAGTDAGG